MQTKALEIRDSMTFIAAIAVCMTPENGEQEYLLRRSGYNFDEPLVVLTAMHGGRQAFYDPYDWADRTFQIAHNYIAKNWAKLRDGDVVDVQFILGETAAPKVSERLEVSAR
jgi:hypothetical protein